MRIKPAMSKRPLLLLLAALLAGGAVAAEPGEQDVANRLLSVDKLLHQSSGARQIQASGDAAAIGKHAEAMELYEAAGRKHEAGDYAGASALLGRASQAMFAAIRLATPASVAQDHAASGLKQRREAAVALRDAFTRISTEPGLADSRERVLGQVDGLLAEADALGKAGRHAEARVEMDKAYHLLKVSIDSLRSGQTLVRSLHFETPRDEYDYEIDRNDTHEMLIGLLVDSKKKSDRTRQQIEDFVAEARRLRQRAEALAGDDDYPQAIDLLEQSTLQLVRAIRSAGVYIPG